MIPLERTIVTDSIRNEKIAYAISIVQYLNHLPRKSIHSTRVPCSKYIIQVSTFWDFGGNCTLNSFSQPDFFFIIFASRSKNLNTVIELNIYFLDNPAKQNIFPLHKIYGWKIISFTCIMEQKLIDLERKNTHH